MPPRRQRPAKQVPQEQPSSLHRIARAVSDWKIVVTGVVLLGSGVGFAFSYKFATKSELATATQPLVDHVARHDIDYARMDQKLDDVVETVHEIRQQLSRLK